MPNYLSPGVYVEEVEAGSRPIEGVGTAVAAFVGLAAQGPFNTPTLVTNWTQFTSDVRRLRRGLVPGAFRVRLLHERRRRLLRRPDRRGRRGTRPPVPSSRAAPTRRWRRTASTPSRPARPATTSRSRSGRRRRRRRLVQAHGQARTGIEEKYEKVTTKKGKQNVVTRRQRAVEADPARGDRQGAARSSGKPAAGKMTLAGGAAAASTSLNPDDYVGDSADRTGFGGLEAIDAVTMVCVPDLMTAYQQGLLDLEGVQGRAAGDDRPLRADGRPDGDPRPAAGPERRSRSTSGAIDKAGYDSKYAALY